MHGQLLRLIRFAGVVGLIMSPVMAQAAGLAPRSVTVGSSAQSATTDYVIAATTATTANIGSVKFEFCDSAVGTCNTPAGLDTTAAVLNAGSPGGFTLDNTINGAPYVTKTAAQITAGTAMSFDLGSVVNPAAANVTYYVHITTYTGSDGVTGPVDNGTVALSTAQPVQLTGVTPEILVFCVGTSITSNCTTITGDTIDFGEFSPVATKTGMSVMQAQTNAANGYDITVSGTTLASGTNTIPAMTTQGPSVVGTSQFGMNVRSNTTPTVGDDPVGAGTGTYTANYGTPNQYRFVSGDVVASANVPTNANTFTSSYIVNIGGLQAAGVYASTLTYICTASF